MGKKCKSCSGVSGIESIPYMSMAGAIGASIVAEKIDKALTTNADGTPKTNADGTPAYLAANPKIKNAAFLAAGAAATMYADGNEIITGLGLGLAVWGGYNLASSMMTPAATSGLGYVPPSQIAGVRNIPGAYGFSPATVGNYAQGMPIPNYQPEPANSGKIKAGY